MATLDDVLAVIKHVTDCTGNPTAWLDGLTPTEVSQTATLLTASPQRLDGLLAKIRQQHRDLFDPANGAMVFPTPRRPGGAPPEPEHQEGAAADAIRAAEVALGQQNSLTAQLDLQVTAAILNAHRKTAAGKETLARLQRDVETAVTTRSDLDTPAGARDFQRILIGKLSEIRAVVASVSLDDTSESALMAAWTSLYNASQGGRDSSEEHQVPAVITAPSSTEVTDPLVAPDAEPYLDSLAARTPGFLPPDVSTHSPPTQMPLVPGIPNLGGGPAPASIPGLSMPGGAPSPGLQAAGAEWLPRGLDQAEDPPPKDRPVPDAPDDVEDEASDSAAAPESLPTGPTTVTLPNGETVTAATPQLAAAIKMAAGGTPIAEAFHQQGITIPAPGTAVTEPIDPSRVTPGDIGMFTNRHALALGNSKALLDGQFQHISTVKGPSFLGWEHPAAPVAVDAPTRTEAPAPTRPAARAGTAQ